ncbi:putative mitochondrial protein AtMg01250 [Nicotiana tabacum]|uniref:Mitochondrial protein AtMg01250 n=1 Tax=Nicotiana tabacum TaxID=4097 RepID=A0AC58SMX7_TOBAC
MVNVQSSGFFKSTRGVKQGDPLSSALFILSAKVLSRSLNKLFEDKSFVGFGMPKWYDPLNHLAYADDTIIFASAHPTFFSKIMVVLGNYDKISGQMINKDKSSYYMHSKVANGLFQAIGAITGFARGKFPFTYLGCPIFNTRRRKDYYEDLIKKVNAKLHSWKGKLL